MSYVRQLKRQKMSQAKKFGDGDPFNYQELNIIGEGERLGWDLIMGRGCFVVGIGPALFAREAFVCWSLVVNV